MNRLFTSFISFLLILFTITISAQQVGSNMNSANSAYENSSGTLNNIFTTQVPDGEYSDGPYELGLKFTTSQIAIVKKVSYYRMSGESGSHIGHVWNNDGTLLANATFSNETATGWQIADLDNPIWIYPGITYVVSVNSNTAYGAGSLATSVINGILSTVDDNNGIFNTTVGQFPSSFFNKIHYFRDVYVEPVSAPTIPELLSPLNNATSVSTEPELNWTASTAAANISYTVQISPDNFATSNYAVYNTGITGTSFQVPVVRSLENNTTYYWRVSAQVLDPDNDPVGTSSFSNVYTFKTKLETPELPSPYNNAVGQPASLTLSWSAVWGATSYYLQVNTQPDFDGQPIFESYSVNTSSKIISNLTLGTKYFWRVRARNTATNDSSNISPTFCFTTTTAQIPIPSYPINGEIVYQNTQSLTWYLNNANGLTFTYDVQYSTDPTMCNGVVTLTDISSTAVDIPLSSGDVTYYWRVRSKEVNSGLYSAYSNTVTFKTDISLGAVSPILSWPISDAVVFSAFPTLTWYLNTGLTPGPVTFDVELLHASDPFTGNPTTGLSGLTGTSVTLNLPLDADAEYHWRVRTHNGTNVSGWSYAEAFKVDLSQGGAPVPILSWPIGGTTVYNASPELSWYLSSSATGPIYYDVDIVPATDSFGSEPAYKYVYGNSICVYPMLTGGVTYKWRVRTHNGSNVSDWSVVTTFTIAIGYNGAPVPVLSWPVGNATVYTTTPKLVWYLGVGTSGSVSFDVELVPANSSFTGTPTYSGIYSSDYQLVNELNSGSSYKWRVRTNNGTSTSPWSNTETFNIVPEPIGAPRPIVAWPNGGATVYTNNPILSWYLPKGPAGLVYYEIELKPFYKAFDGTNLISYVYAQSYYVSTNLVSGTSYHWRVRLISSTAGASPWSDMSPWGGAWFTTVSSPLSSVAPSLGSPSNGMSVPGNNPFLSWMVSTVPASNQTYRLEVSTNENMSSPVLVKENLTDPFIELNALTSGTYYWRVQSKNEGNSYSDFSPVGIFKIDAVTGIDDNNKSNTIPAQFELSQNYPNPFNPSTVIKFSLPEASLVSLNIYNILGQEVMTLLNENKNAGTYSVQWNGENNFGNKVSSGAYIYRIIAGNNVVTKKMILMK